mgnify:CR=1 FL=1
MSEAGVTPSESTLIPGFILHLDNFDGPFDLLLQLISRHKMDVTEVALSVVTDEFIAHIRSMDGGWKLETATEFLVVAATLLDLKAARLLPSGEIEDEEDLETTTTATDDAREAGAALAESLIEDAKDADQEQIIRGLSMVANIERIADSLDQNSPALKDVITPDEPAHAKVMAVSPIDQTLKLNKRITKRVRGVIRKYF